MSEPVNGSAPCVGETATPELVLLHGGAQNAHTWDTVALALDRPLLALDLPGHGHSDWRDDRDYWPVRNAEAVAEAMRALVPAPVPVVGMSLGGLTAIRLAATAPELVTSLVVVDVTPGVTMAKSAPIVDFVQGPESFAELRGVAGTHDRAQPDPLGSLAAAGNPAQRPTTSRRPLGVALRPAAAAGRRTRLRAPLGGSGGRSRRRSCCLIGADSGVVAADDVEEFLRRRPETRVETRGRRRPLDSRRPAGADWPNCITEFRRPPTRLKLLV